MKKQNIVTIILIGIIISMFFIILNMKNKNIEGQEIVKEQLEEATANSSYIALSTHMNELYDKEEKLLLFKTQISDYIAEAGGVKPEYTEDIVTFGESIKGIVTEVTKNATATAEDIAEGKTAWVNGELLLGNRVDDSSIEKSADFRAVIKVIVVLANTGTGDPTSKTYNITLTRINGEYTCTSSPGGYFVRLDSNAAYISSCRLVSFEYI